MPKSRLRRFKVAKVDVLLAYDHQAIAVATEDQAVGTTPAMERGMMNELAVGNVPYIKMAVICPPAKRFASGLAGYCGQQRSIRVESHIGDSGRNLRVKLAPARSAALRNVPCLNHPTRVGHGQMSAIGAKDDIRTNRRGGVAFENTAILGRRHIHINTFSLVTGA
jgi:hypothetical protein